ncbi:MAG: sulfotransferase domain-containing protein [Leptolyngbyaceae cyanobacterium MO_188.B28]|nr:sulfotransferase domain-containing protein [Leptolyngbyaceae cyanobacterium MO_188.B28]
MLKNFLSSTKKKNSKQSNPYEKHWLWSNKIHENYMAQDIFLVAYPKSGSTYLRFLIANSIKAHYQLEREVNFFSIQDIVPWITKSKLSPLGPFGETNLPRIIKSHFAFNDKYRRVILLVRDPRDVLVSYYHHTKKYKLLNNDLIPEDWTLSQFIRDSEYMPKLWSEHTKSWYNCRQNLDKNIQVFRFEDFLLNAEETLHRLMYLIGINMSEESLKYAINSSSKVNMKQSEQESISTFTLKNQKTQFVRKAEMMNGKELTESDKKYIEDETREIAQMVGYDF